MFHNITACASIALLLAFTSPVASFALSDMDYAKKELADKHLAIDNESFIAEVTAGHTDNVALFLKAGAAANLQNNDGTTAIMAALTVKTPDMLNLLIASLPGDAAATTFNLKDKKGLTALLQAVAQGNEPYMDILLAHGADVSIGSASFTTPLMLAVQQKNVSMVVKLLAADPKRATVALEDSKGDTALTYAITGQMPELVKLLLDAHADAVKPDTIGVSPMMLAAKGGDETIAQMLIAAGAKIGEANKSGETPISIAIRSGHSKLARMLIEKDPTSGAAMNYSSALVAALEADTVDPEFFAYLLDHAPKTAPVPASLLFSALDRKNHDVAELLLDRKVDIHATSSDGGTLFYHAVDSGFEDITLELIRLGADISQTGVSATPIARAVRHNMPKVVALLIDKGASADQKTQEGYTLAEMCVYSGYPETLEVLLNKGVKLEKEFALQWSIRDGKGKAVPVLLNHGATSNIMNQDGIPAISLAAEAGESEAVKAFIEHKALIDYPSKTQHMTALAAAARAGHLDIVTMLVEAGAKLETADNFGMTPLAHAASASKADVVEYLLSKGASAKAVDGQKRSVSDIAAQAPVSAERDRIMLALSKVAAK